MPDAPTYGIEHDWQYTEGVVDAGYVYGPDRYAPGARPIAPASGVKVRPANPTQNQIAVAAATVGFKVTDKVFTIWAETLRETPVDRASEAIVPSEGDRLVVDGVTWIIKWIREAIYAKQHICYCERSAATNTVY